MKTFRDSFEENYMAYEEPCGNRRGFCVRYAYVGLWYVYRLERGEKTRYKRLFGFLCALGTLFFGLAALQKCELNYRSFPSLFSGLFLAVLLFLWYAVGKFIFSAEKITEHSFREMDGVLRLAPWVGTVLLLGASISCLYLLIRDGLSAGPVTVPLFYFLSGCCVFLIAFFYRALPYEKQKNGTAKDGSKKFIRM